MDQGSRCGVVIKVTEWPATIDRRYYDAVIFELDGVVAGIASGDVPKR
jgi:hypothetical protein